MSPRADPLQAAEKRRQIAEANAATEVAKLRAHVARDRRRRMSTYDGAKTDRRDRDWSKKAVSADGAILPDLGTCNARARQLIRDTAPGRSISRSFRRNVVGRGITPSSAPEIGTEDERIAFANSVDSLWRDYSRDQRSIDAEGVKVWREIQAQVITELIAVGGILVRHVVTRNGPDMPGIRIQLLEVEQLDSSRDRNNETGNSINGGVEVDSFNRPVAYWLHSGNPADLNPNTRSREPRRISADQIDHLYVQEIPGQSRGITELAAILRKARSLTEYDSLELWAAHIQATLGIGIERPAGNSDDDIGFTTENSADTTDDEGNKTAQWEGGMSFVGAPGEKIHFYAPNRPSGQYDPYTKAQLRQIAAATGLSYEQVARDFSAGTYSAQRQSLLEDRREWEPLQEYLIDRLCRPFWSAWLDVAIMGGHIVAPAYFAARRLYAAADWQPDGWSWIDPSREAAAAKLALEAKIDTRDRILNRQGTSVRAVFEQRARETALGERYGVEIPEEAEAEPATSPSEPRPEAGTREPTANSVEPELFSESLADTAED